MSGSSKGSQVLKFSPAWRQRKRMGRSLFFGAVLLLAFTSLTIALTGVASADLTTNQQIQAAVAQAPFTPGLPFASGQTITISVPANTLLPHGTNLHLIECDAGPGGGPPTGTPVCDGPSQYGGNAFVSNTDGSLTVTGLTGFTVFALPSPALAETASNPVQCGGASSPCIIYIGPAQTTPALPHVWSQAFSGVQTDAGETGTVNPGDGTIPSTAAAPDAALSTVTTSAATAVANGVDSSTVTATMLGKNAQQTTAPVPQGTSVTLAPVSGSSHVSPATAVTDVNGVATFTVTFDAVGE